MSEPDDARPSTARVTTVDRPLPGSAVLACRCGSVLALADMHRPVRNRPRSPAVIDPICCEHCAVEFSL